MEKKADNIKFLDTSCTVKIVRDTINNVIEILKEIDSENLNNTNDELKSDIVKLVPAITKDAVIKTVNGIIDYLKTSNLIKNFFISNPYLEEKVDSLPYNISTPITIQTLKKVINDIIDILKNLPI